MESHVLPAFVFRWLKAYSVTGHIRHTDTPNRRVQDGIKKPWLCELCEQRFSRYETAFATKLFHPWLKGVERVRYGDWLLKFCVSVSWRVLKHCRGLNPDTTYTAEQELLLDQAEARWREFLEDRVPHPGKFEQHLLIWDLIESTNAPGLPPNINRFLSGAITMDIVGSERRLMTFSKLGRFMLFGTIQSCGSEWAGTKVHVRDGILEPGGTIGLPVGVMEYINERAAMAAQFYDGISDAQHQKMEAAAMRDLDRIANSDQFAAMLADADMFGEDVIIRRRRNSADA